MHRIPLLQYFRFFTEAGPVVKTERGVRIGLEEAWLAIEMMREDVVRLAIVPVATQVPPTSVAICVEPGPVPPFRVREEDTELRLETARVTVRVRRSPFRLAAFRADGSPLFQDHCDATGASHAYGCLNDGFVISRRIAPRDHILGLGERTGRLDRRGRTYSLWNTDVLGHLPRDGRPPAPEDDPTSTRFDPYYVSIPFFHHLNDETGDVAGFFIDNPHRAVCDFTPEDHYSLAFTAGSYTEYVFAGPHMRDILKGFTWLTGRPAPPPLWSLGHHQCRWHPYTEETLMALAKDYRQRQIPCDALWLDIDHMDGYRVFTWDRERFADPTRLCSALEQEGFRLVTIVDPGIKAEPGYAPYDEGQSLGHLCKTEGGDIYIGAVWPGRTAFPDFPRAETRAWWTRRIARHVQDGIAGIWNDMNEPATGAIDPEPMRFHQGTAPHGRHHNEYALWMAQATVEGLSQARPGARPFVLSRAGSAGIQRYAANWLGDNQSRWDHLWMSLPMAMGLGLSGQPLVGADVGGFGGDCTPELLTRWYQCAALTPFFRNHAAWDSREQTPWSFGAAVERACREAIRLRYRLLPYLYSTIMHATESGEPVQRPLLYAFPTDRAARDVDDQYLVGDHLLVAPVYREGVRRRSVYLPQGTWHPWYGGEPLQGPTQIEADAPLRHIPLYVRGGSVIPALREPPLTTMGHHPKTLLLHLFLPAEDGHWQSRLHEDDGLTFDFKNGACYRTEFRLERSGSRFTLSTTVDGQGFPDFRRRGFQLRFHGDAVHTLNVDGETQVIERNTLDIPNAGQRFSMVATLAPQSPNTSSTSSSTRP